MVGPCLLQHWRSFSAEKSGAKEEIRQDSRGEGLLLDAASPWPWWQASDLLQKPDWGKRCWGVSPTARTLRFPYTGMNGTPYKQMIDTVTVHQTEGGSVVGIALTAVCNISVDAWAWTAWYFLPCREGQTVWLKIQSKFRPEWIPP